MGRAVARDARSRTRRAAAALPLALALGAGPAGGQDAPPAAPADRAARIAELEAAVERDEETVRRLLAETTSREGVRLYESSELREIAHRLPELQAALLALRESDGGPGSDLPAP